MTPQQAQPPPETQQAQPPAETSQETGDDASTGVIVGTLAGLLVLGGGLAALKERRRLAQPARD